MLWILVVVFLIPEDRVTAMSRLAGAAGVLAVLAVIIAFVRFQVWPLSGQAIQNGEGVDATLRRHHIRHIIGVVLTVLLILAIGTGAVYVALLQRIVSTNIRHETLLPTPSAASTPPEDTSAIEAPTPEPLASKGSVNILLVGADALNGTIGGRADAIILVHVSSDRKKVYLVHFPRDMYVEVPGHGNDKINAAYAYGGTPLLINTLRGLVDVPIDHVAIIERKGFIRMTDALGGVDVYADEPSTEFEVTIHVGMNHLNGDEAEVFVLERHQLSEGDISRGRRQQEFLKALLFKALSKETLTNPVRFAQFVDAATRYLVVDKALSIGQLYSLALSLRNLRSDDVVFVTAPITGFGRSPQGASIDIVDKAKMARLSEALRTDTMSAYVTGQ